MRIGLYSITYLGLWYRGEALTLEPERFYSDFVRALLDIGYDGYIGYELCHPLPVVSGATAGIDFVDRNARLAAEYMRQAIAGAQCGVETEASAAS
jgi:hypothetical protein